ncbi:MAG: hypothetical protein M3463_23910, partial [Verrucomicrobiota bacterium]|nr:hypothetical protein [Verrucomicrobiota bacterium]
MFPPKKSLPGIWILVFLGSAGASYIAVDRLQAFVSSASRFEFSAPASDAPSVQETAPLSSDLEWSASLSRLPRDAALESIESWLARRPGVSPQSELAMLARLCPRDSPVRDEGFDRTIEELIAGMWARRDLPAALAFARAGSNPNSIHARFAAAVRELATWDPDAAVRVLAGPGQRIMGIKALGEIAFDAPLPAAHIRELSERLSEDRRDEFFAAFRPGMAAE